MPVGRAARRRERQARVIAAFGEAQASAALDLVELLELAWHDCYGEITPPPGVIEDILVLSDGTLQGLVRAARLAVTDPRDLKLAAEDHRGAT